MLVPRPERKEESMSNAATAAATNVRHLDRVDGARRLEAVDRELIDQAATAFEVLQGKWKLNLIVILARGIRRHSRLLDCLPGVSKKVMTGCLRGLERDGLVVREIFAEVPARVEYSLTPLGWEITDAIVALSQWTEDHRDELEHARRTYRERTAAAAEICPVYRWAEPRQA
jgi:DNA-binding HxlR family transcriptional regulator